MLNFPLKNPNDCEQNGRKKNNNNVGAAKLSKCLQCFFFTLAK